jgi:hypothetical protein
MNLFKSATLITLAVISSLSTVTPTFTADGQEKESFEPSPQHQRSLTTLQPSKIILGEIAGYLSEKRHPDTVPCDCKDHHACNDRSHFLQTCKIINQCRDRVREIQISFHVSEQHFLHYEDIIQRIARSFLALQYLSLNKPFELFSALTPKAADLTGLNLLKNLQHLEMGVEDAVDENLELLIGLNNLQHLELLGTFHITDAGLTYICQLPKLKTLKLMGMSKVTDVGVNHLSGILSLQQLDLSRLPKVTVARIDSFRLERKDCQVNWDR